MLVLAIQFSRIEERNEATAVGGGFVGSRGWSIAPAPRERDQVIGALSNRRQDPVSLEETRLTVDVQHRSMAMRVIGEKPVTN